MLANYHTHNVRCGHAYGTLEEYTVEAIKKGMDELGHSDHFPLPFDALNDGRMKYADLASYKEEFEQVKAKHGNEIKLFIGGEIEYLPDFNNYYERCLTTGGYDYFLLGQHFYTPNGWDYKNVYVDFKGANPPIMDYAKSCMEGMKTGYFAYLAHPDLFFLNDIKIDDNCKKAISYMVEEADKNNYILELNCGGAAGIKEFANTGTRPVYGKGYFWEEVAKTNIRCIIGSDAHEPGDVYTKTNEELKAYAKELGLNLIDHIDIKK